jgi:hypothetical protein
VPDIDPIWQFDYERQVFAFVTEDYFLQEKYEDQEEP